MGTALWIVQGLLAIAFLLAGVMKLMQPKEKLAEQMAWVNDFSQNQVRGIGVLEILGAVGLVVPMLINRWEFFTPLAGLGFVLLMLGAAFTHYRRKEPQMIAINAVLLLLAAFVIYGRYFAVGVG